MGTSRLKPKLELRNGMNLPATRINISLTPVFKLASGALFIWVVCLLFLVALPWSFDSERVAYAREYLDISNCLCVNLGPRDPAWPLFLRAVSTLNLTPYTAIVLIIVGSIGTLALSLWAWVNSATVTILNTKKKLTMAICIEAVILNPLVQQVTALNVRSGVSLALAFSALVWLMVGKSKLGPWTLIVFGLLFHAPIGIVGISAALLMHVKSRYLSILVSLAFLLFIAGLGPVILRRTVLSFPASAKLFDGYLQQVEGLRLFPTFALLLVVSLTLLGSTLVARNPRLSSIPTLRLSINAAMGMLVPVSLLGSIAYLDRLLIFPLIWLSAIVLIILVTKLNRIGLVLCVLAFLPLTLLSLWFLAKNPGAVIAVIF